MTSGQDLRQALKQKAKRRLSIASISKSPAAKQRAPEIDDLDGGLKF